MYEKYRSKITNLIRDLETARAFVCSCEGTCNECVLGIYNKKPCNEMYELVETLKILYGLVATK